MTRRTGQTRRITLAILALAGGVAYLTWRIGWTLNVSPWLAIPLVTAEAVAFVRFALGLVATLPEPSTGDAAPSDVAQPTVTPSVELLIPAAHTGPDELARTLTVAIRCAEQRTGDVDIRVLDCSHRGDMAREAIRFGASYDVLDADPGDGPAALFELARRTADADVLAWINAGDVPVPGFLDLADLLADPEHRDLAVVQSGVDLINRDSLLHLVPDRDELALENRVAGPSLDRAGAAPWEGSGSLVRADALEQVGGLPAGGSPTHQAALRLAREGRTTRWAMPPLVRTVAPDHLADYLHDAGEQAHADWTTLFSADSPLIATRLGFRRRAWQLHRSTEVLDGLVRLTFLAVLVAVLVTAQLPLSASLGVLLLAFGTQFALRTAATLAVGRRTIGLGDATRQGLRLMGVHLTALFRRPSPQPPDGGFTRFAVLGRLPLLTVALLSVDVALLVRGLTFIWPDLLPAFGDGERFVVMAAAVWAIIPMVDVLQVLAGRVQRRQNHRASTDLVAEVDGRPCRTIDLTPHGVGLLLPDRLEGVHDVMIRLDLPRLDQTVTTVRLPARLRHVAEVGEVEDGRFRAGASFTRVDPDARDALVEFCALTATQRDRMRDDAPTATPEDLTVTGGGTARNAFAAINVVALLFAGLVVAAGPAGAAPGGGMPGMPGAGTGAISGQVLDPQGQPLTMGCVWVQNGPSYGNANTDSSGNFSITGLPAGSYRVVANNCGGNQYVQTFAGGTSGGTPWNNEASTFNVTDNSTQSAGTITLHPAATLSGTAVDGTGTPVANVCVTFVPDGHQSSWWGFGTTANDGTFTGALPAGENGKVQFNDCTSPQRFLNTWYGNTTDQQQATPVQVPAGQSLDLGQVTMTTGALVTGTVRDDQGAPVSNACVSAQVIPNDGSNWQWIGGTNTTPTGQYQFMVPPGTYSMWFSDCNNGNLVSQWYPDTPNNVREKPTVDVPGSGATFDATLHTGGRASGRVTDAQGNPATDVCVALHSEDSLNGNDNGSSTWDYVAPDGTWTSQPVLPGRYFVEYQNCQNGQQLQDGEWIHEIRPDVYVDNRRWSIDDIQMITITADQTTTGVDDDLLRAGHVSGVIRSNGQPVGDVCIGGTNAGNDDQRRSAQDGSWSTTLMPGEPVALTFTDCTAGRGLSQQSASVTAAEGERLTLDVDMTDGPITTISGTVHNAAGRALQPACAVAYVPNNLIGYGLVQPDGTFSIPGLGNGTYWLAAFGCGDDDPMVDPDTGVGYGPTWFPGIPMDFGSGNGPTDPVQAGATTYVLDGSLPLAAELCVPVACSTTPPTTTPTPPTTTPPAPPATTPAVPPPSGGSGGSGDGPSIPNPFTGTAPTRPPTLTPIVPGPSPSLLLYRTRPAAKATGPATTSAATGASTTVATPPAASSDVVAAAVAEVPGTAEISNAPLSKRIALGDPTAASEDGFPWDIAGGVLLITAAGVAMVLIWRRRHPGFA